MILSELIPFLKSLDAKPKKALSQNFLIDPNIIRKIVQTAAVAPGDLVLEIGPGPGALTSALLNQGAHVFAVEMDASFARELHRLQNGNLTVFEADILKFPLEQLPPHIKVVANLPYHITTPILEKIFATSFSTLTIMVQKEVADRMEAVANTKEFGCLSLFVQFHTQKHSSFKVPSSCFYPRPKVDSTVIRLDSKPIPKINPLPLARNAFQQRRKMLTSTLLFPKEIIKAALASIDMRIDARPEDLSLEKWIHLSQILHPSKQAIMNSPQK